MVKYYGLKNKENKEYLMYMYARKRAKLLSLLPGKRSKFWKINYKDLYETEHYFGQDDNSIPPNGSFQLYSVVIGDLIKREDIKQLQKGVKFLLKKRSSNKFLLPIHEGLDEICRKIEQMDTSLLSWYNYIDCGIFELKSKNVNKSIDYYTLKISNVNSGYLSLIFNVHLSQDKIEQLNSLISCNYDDRRGYAFQTVVKNSKKIGAFKNYSIVHYNNSYLKADKIYEFISYLEWEFLNELSTILPLVLHKKSIMPPRIEIYNTNIDYHDEKRDFWNSIGISDYQGQFIDQQHKMFYEHNLSERYGNLYRDNRIIYVFKDDGKGFDQFRSIKNKVHYHIDEYAVEYFRFMFLDILSREAGKTLILYKHRLDKVKLKRYHLNELLKLKYKLSSEIDDYNRYKRDDVWEKSKKKLDEVYKYNDLVAELSSKATFISHTNFCKNAIFESEKLDKDIAIIMSEFEEKKNILQNLTDYKNTTKSIRLNVIMLILTAMTLLFVIFPDWAEDTAKLISDIWNYICDFLYNCFDM